MCLPKAAKSLSASAKAKPPCVISDDYVAVRGDVAACMQLRLVAVHLLSLTVRLNSRLLCSRIRVKSVNADDNF